MIPKKSRVTCKNCKFEFQITKIPFSAGSFGHTTDMRYSGIAPLFPVVIQCNRCFYMFVKDELNVDEKLLHEYVQSDTYKNLLKSENKYMILFHTYKSLKASIAIQNKALLYNYYKTQDMTDFKLLVDGYILFLQEHKKEDEDYLFANTMIGEYYRRMSEFEKSEDIFAKLLDLDITKNLDLREKCLFQLELIKDKKRKVDEFRAD